MLATSAVILILFFMLFRVVRENGFYFLHITLVIAASFISEYYIYAPSFSKQAFFYSFIIHLTSINFVTFITYAYDKRAARKHAWRVPENLLHVFAFLGGTPAAFIAQKHFHHKTKKRPFLSLSFLIFYIQLIALGFLGITIFQ